MATSAVRAPVRRHYKSWDKARAEHLYGALRLLALGSGLLLAALSLVF